jgi:hypothetical protein
MIGKKTSEVWPIAKDETRVEENASANGTVRQKVLFELEKTRDFFELMIFSRYMVIAGRTVGKMRDADRVCKPWWGRNRGLLVLRSC